MATQKSKPFVIATEGQTIDGRHISREWITQMAANYKPTVYTVVNLEHFLSMHPDSAFSAYGKVVGLSTRETEIFGQKRLQLLATVEASDAAVSMQREGKKCYASIEVVPNFTGLGQAYLTGLALTDMPASLGTEPMRFSAFSDGKTENVFAFPGETEFSFDATPCHDAALPAPSGGGQLFEKVKELLGLREKTDEGRLASLDQAILHIALSQKDLLDRQTKLDAAHVAVESKVKDVAAHFSEMEQKLSAIPATLPRPAASGGNGSLKTDC